MMIVTPASSSAAADWADASRAMITVGIFRALEISPAVSGVRSRESKITRVGGIRGEGPLERWRGAGRP